MKKTKILLSLAVLTSLSIYSCSNHNQEINPSPTTNSNPTTQNSGTNYSLIANPNLAPENLKNSPTGIATVSSLNQSKVKGIVMLIEKDNKLYVNAHIEGLNPNQKHGFHIHENGDCSDNGKAAGSHYDPQQTKNHGKPHEHNTHAGDMGNLLANDQGIATYQATLEGLSIRQKNSVVGKAIIIHAKEDIYTNPSGNAGDRIGCGVIKSKRSMDHKQPMDDD